MPNLSEQAQGRPMTAGCAPTVSGVSGRQLEDTEGQQGQQGQQGQGRAPPSPPEPPFAAERRASFSVPFIPSGPSNPDSVSITHVRTVRRATLDRASPYPDRYRATARAMGGRGEGGEGRGGVSASTASPPFGAVSRSRLSTGEAHSRAAYGGSLARRGPASLNITPPDLRAAKNSNARLCMAKLHVQREKRGHARARAVSLRRAAKPSRPADDDGLGFLAVGGGGAAARGKPAERFRLCGLLPD